MDGNKLSPFYRLPQAGSRSWLQFYQAKKGKNARTASTRKTPLSAHRINRRSHTQAGLDGLGGFKAQVFAQSAACNQHRNRQSRPLVTSRRLACRRRPINWLRPPGRNCSRYKPLRNLTKRSLTADARSRWTQCPAPSRMWQPRSPGRVLVKLAI